MARKILIAGMLLLLTSVTFAQNGLIKQANKRYDALSFKEAAQLYELAAEKGATDAVIASRTADSYWRVRDMKNAERWYEKASILANAAPQDVYRYSETLRSNGKMELADQALSRYKGLASGDSRADKQADAKAYVEELKSTNLLGAEVKNLDVNSDRCDMGVGLYGDRVTFASSRRDKASESRNHTWNNAPFLDLYTANPSVTGALSDVALLDGPFNTKYHESNAVVTASNKEIWFTRNNYEGNKRKRDEQGVTGLKIFSSTRSDDGTWNKEVGFIHNNDRYSVGHPALSPDGNRLYFTSNRPGGKGGTDIWYCEKGGVGGWSAAVNAEAVNTEGNEMFPFAGQEGVLFFASDGHKGLGGLDVMMATITGDGFGAPRNVGAPINSTADDFAFVMKNDKLGYLTSNRAGGHGDDDIYAVTVTKKTSVELKMNGVARDAVSKQPLEGVLVKMIGPDGVVLDSIVTAANGAYSFPLVPGRPYTIKAEMPDHAPVDGVIAALPEADTLLVHDVELLANNAISLSVQAKDAKTGNPIPDAEVQLIEEPSKKVVLEGRTDANGFLKTALSEKKVGDDLNLRIRLAHPKYLTTKTTYSEPIKGYGEIKLHDLLDLRMQPMEVGGDLGKMIDIKPIYFDVNKSNIRPDAATELNKIVEVMKEQPNMTIELGSHTDCRAAKAYNESLSDRRAKSSAAYIVSKGIAANRITGKGFGESKLVNGCACEGNVKSDCSEEDHQLNRRTEFIIVKM